MQTRKAMRSKCLIRLPPIAAVLTVLLGVAAPAAAQIAVSNLWSIPAGSRDYVTINSSPTERGVAINPVTGHVLIATRTGGNTIVVLDPDTGQELARLANGGVIAGGTLLLVQVGAADDGAIYACNLVTSGLTGLKVYRWGSEDPNALPVVAFQGTSGTGLRYGDSMDVRGSGPNTQIVISGTGNSRVALLTTTDGTNFTATELTISSPMAAGDFAKGLCFGAGNTLWGKNWGSADVRHARFDPLAGTLTHIQTLSLDSRGVALSLDTNRNLLAVVVTATTGVQTDHRFKVYDISIPSAPLTVADFVFPAPNTNNANAIGAVDFVGDRIVALDCNNGIMAFRVVSLEAVPPAFSSNPQGGTVVKGGYFLLSAGAVGSLPISYQWRLNGVPLPGKTNVTLLLTNVTLAEAGHYTVVAVNAHGSATSAVATVVVEDVPYTDKMIKLWHLAPGDRPYLSTDNSQRGLAYNPLTDHLLLVSRTGGDAVHILDSATGAHLGTLNNGPNPPSGGTFAMNLVGVAEDGQIYVCNLTLNGTTTPLKIYRWFDESPDQTPVVVWEGDPGMGAAQRWGDTMAVRGADLNTQILLASRLGTVVALIMPEINRSRPIAVLNVPGAAGGDLGLGLAWGEGDTFWATAVGRPLRRIAFDPSTGEVRTLQTISSFPMIANIGVDPSRLLLAGVCRGTQDTLRLYSVFSPRNPMFLDTEFFATDHANDNATGAAVFSPDGRLFALNSNNGLLAMRVGPRLRWSLTGTTLTLSWDPGYVLQSAPTLAGPYQDVPGAASGLTVNVSSGGLKFFRLR